MIASAITWLLLIVIIFLLRTAIRMLFDVKVKIDYLVSNPIRWEDIQGKPRQW